MSSFGSVINPVKCDFMPLVKNRAGHAICASIYWGVQELTNLYGRLQYGEKLKSGAIHLLHPPTDISAEEGIEILIRKISGEPTKTPAPLWIRDFEVPGEAEMNAEIDKLQKKLADLHNQCDEATEYKKLLFEHGSALEGVVEKAFTLMKIEVRPGLAGKEDRLLFIDSKEVKVEVKGKEGSIALQDLRQLGHYLEDAALDGKSVKGLFIGNHYRLEHPKKRPEAFPDNVIEYAEKRGICLITTIELFKAVCKVLAGKPIAELKEKILNGVGVTKLT